MFSARTGFYYQPETGELSFLVAGHSASPYLTGWTQDGNTFTEWANADTLPGGTVFNATVSADGKFVATVGATSYLDIYERTGSSLARLSNPASMPATTQFGSHFDSTSTYLATSGDGSGTTLRIYKISGNTFTKLSDPATMPDAQVRGLMFDPTSTYLCALPRLSTTNKLLIYKRTGDTFANITANIDTVPNVSSPVQNTLYCHWGANATYLSVGMEQSPYVYIYKRTGDNFALLSSPFDVAPNDNTRGAFFSPDNTYLVQVQQTTPFVRFYKRSGDTWSDISSNVDTLPVGTTNGISVTWTSDSNYVAIATTDNDRPVAVYYRSGDTFTLVDSLLPSTTDGRGVCFYPRADNG